MPILNQVWLRKTLRNDAFQKRLKNFKESEKALHSQGTITVLPDAETIMMHFDTNSWIVIHRYGRLSTKMLQPDDTWMKKSNVAPKDHQNKPATCSTPTLNEQCFVDNVNRWRKYKIITERGRPTCRFLSNCFLPWTGTDLTTILAGLCYR